MLDLDAYFDRIAWGGSTAVTLDTLAGLLGAHMAHIPFENLDVLLGRSIRLDLEGLQNKLVVARRGGYCFEHATLLAAVLEELGFAPVRHTARVVLFTAPAQSPRTHMMLKVPLREGTFIVDPGFGALAPRVPIALADGASASVGDERHWLVREGSWWVLRARSGEAVVDAWMTTLDHDQSIDFEVGNHYTATHPRSPFVNRLMMRALAADGRVTIANRDLTVTRGGEQRRTELANRRELRAAVAEHFGVDLPEIERLRVPTIPEWT
jgi:N-hydroxyarylamine O-acetyltransferase